MFRQALLCRSAERVCCIQYQYKIPSINSIDYSRYKRKLYCHRKLKFTEAKGLIKVPLSDILHQIIEKLRRKYHSFIKRSFDCKALNYHRLKITIHGIGAKKPNSISAQFKSHLLF